MTFISQSVKTPILSVMDHECVCHFLEGEIIEINPNYSYTSQQVAKQREFYLAKLVEDDKRLMAVRKEIAKLMGQYKFYLNKEKKNELTSILKPLAKVRALKYDFSNESCIEKIEANRDKYIKGYNADIAAKYKSSIATIEKFIEEN